jgi:hypothetical protein
MTLTELTDIGEVEDHRFAELACVERLLEKDEFRLGRF